MNRFGKRRELVCNILLTTDRGSSLQSVLRPHMPLTQILKYWVPVVLYASLIVFLSSLSSPGVKVPSLFWGFDDKIIHAIEYAILAVLCYRAYLWTFDERLTAFAPILAIATAVLFGVTDEIHQAFVPFRHADVWDLVADAVGSFLGVAAWKWHREISTLEPSA